MKNIIHLLKVFIILILFLSISLGCATRVTYSRMMPAEIDMSDARNIAIFHVDESSGNSILSNIPKKFNWKQFDWRRVLDSVTNTVSSSVKGESLTMEKRVADYATDLLTESLAGTDYFQIIDPSEVKKQIAEKNISRDGQAKIGAMLGVDAVVVGNLSRLDHEDSNINVDQFYVDDQGQKRSRTIKRIKREFDFTMNYRVVKTGTGSVITSRNFTDSASDIEDLENKDNLRDPEDVFKGMVRKAIKVITKQLAPYPVREFVSLLADKAKDPRMQKAEEFVDNQLYGKALEVFLDVWKTTRNEAAAYNASVMYEVENDLDLAQKMMDQAIQYYPSKKNMRRLARIERLKSDLKQLNNQLN